MDRQNCYGTWHRFLDVTKADQKTVGPNKGQKRRQGDLLTESEQKITDAEQWWRQEEGRQGVTVT